MVFENRENNRFHITKYLEKDVPLKYYYNESSQIYSKLKENVINKNSIYQYRRTFVRENKSGLCPTLTENMGSGGHNVPIIIDPYTNGIRKLTPRECFNLQGFPEDYKFGNLSDTKLYKIAGNAVTLSIISLIVKQLNLKSK